MPPNGRRHWFAELAGWYGTAAIVGAYALVSFSVIGASSVAYQVLNVSGAAGIFTISAVKGVRQSMALNAFWAAIGLLALVGMAR